MQKMEDKKQNRQEAKFVFGDADIEAEITWLEGDADCDIRFFDPNTGYQNSAPSSAVGSSYHQNSDDVQNIRSLVYAVEQWEDWSEHLTWDDGAEDVFEFEWDGKSYTGYTDMEGNAEYKELIRK